MPVTSRGFPSPHSTAPAVLSPHVPCARLCRKPPASAQARLPNRRIQAARPSRFARSGLFDHQRQGRADDAGARPGHEPRESPNNQPRWGNATRTERRHGQCPRHTQTYRQQRAKEPWTAPFARGDRSSSDRPRAIREPCAGSSPRRRRRAVLRDTPPPSRQLRDRPGRTERPPPRHRSRQSLSPR